MTQVLLSLRSLTLINYVEPSPSKSSQTFFINDVGTVFISYKGKLNFFNIFTLKSKKEIYY